MIDVKPFLYIYINYYITLSAKHVTNCWISKLCYFDFIRKQWNGSITWQHFECYTPLDVNAKAGLLVPQASLPGDNIHSTESSNYRPKSLFDACLQSTPTSYGLIGNKIVTNAAPFESSLFSSSMSEIFSQKCKSLFHAIPSIHV